MRALLTAGALSLAFTLFLTPLFIRLFTRLGWGQFIRDDGPKSHHVKRGTPTMGGIIFILGSALRLLHVDAAGVERAADARRRCSCLGMMVGLGAVGFIDDFLKTRKKQSLGLGGWAKVVGQVVVATAFALLALQFPNDENVTPGRHEHLVRPRPRRSTSWCSARSSASSST